MKKPIMNDFDVSIYSEYPEEYYMDLAKYWEFIAMSAIEDSIGDDDVGFPGMTKDFVCLCNEVGLNEDQRLEAVIKLHEDGLCWDYNEIVAMGSRNKSISKGE